MSSAIDAPVLFITGHATFARVGALAALHEREGIEVALFGGRSHHGSAPIDHDLPFPHMRVRQRDLFRLAAARRHRAVVCSTGGRIALPAGWAGARAAGVPLVLWSSLWAHPRTPAHLASYLALARLYRSADAIVTYGPHVSEYVRKRGAKTVFVAPQSVDNEFWGADAVEPPRGVGWPADTQVKFLFAGRPTREKGLKVLIEAWHAAGFEAPSAALVLAGAGSSPPWIPAGGAVHALERVDAAELRNLYDAADVLVVPSIQTRTFREPWGLVVNEAMNRKLAVICSDAVGAAAGGLVQDGRNGLVVPAGDVRALAAAMQTLVRDPELRTRMGQAGAADVQAYDHAAWAAGFSQALGAVGLSRERW